MESNSLFLKNQFGFQKHHETIHAVIKAIEMINEEKMKLPKPSLQTSRKPLTLSIMTYYLINLPTME